MTNQPGLRMLLEKVKLLLMGPPSNKQPSRPPDASVKDETGGIPLEIGNELLITDTVIKLHKRLSNSLGRVVIIDQLPAAESRMIKASAFGIQVNVDMHEAQQMRAAYMLREQT